MLHHNRPQVTLINLSDPGVMVVIHLIVEPQFQYLQSRKFANTFPLDPRNDPKVKKPEVVQLC